MAWRKNFHSNTYLSAGGRLSPHAQTVVTWLMPRLVNSLTTGMAHFRTICFMLWEMLWHSIGLSPIIPCYNFNFFRKSLTQTWLKGDSNVTQLVRSQINCRCATKNTGTKLCQTGQYLRWLWFENFHFWV